MKKIITQPHLLPRPFMRKPAWKDILEYSDYFSSNLSQHHHLLRKQDKEWLDVSYHPRELLYASQRQPDDTILKLWKERKCAGVILPRDGLPEINTTHDIKDMYKIRKSIMNDQGGNLHYDLLVDYEIQERVYIDELKFHMKFHDWPLCAFFRRFIPGQPNKMHMSILPYNYQSSWVAKRGGIFRPQIYSAYFNVYVENHPRVIYCDVNNMIPGDSYRVHDLKLDLPDGIELVHDEKIPDDNTVIFEFEIGIRSEIIRLTEESQYDYTRIYDLTLALKQLPPIETQKDKELKLSTFLTQSEEDRIRKLAQHLGKTFEEVRDELLAARNAKAKKK